MLTALQLTGMRAAYDEIIMVGVKREHSIEKIIGGLLAAQIAANNARSINYQIRVAKLPLAKDLAGLELARTRSTAGWSSSSGVATSSMTERNVVLVGGTGTGKTHIAIGIARNIIRAGRKARFFNVVDLVNKLEAEAKAGRTGRIADGLMRVDLLILDELWLPAVCRVRRPVAVPSDQPLVRTNLNHRHDQLGLRRMADRLYRSENDDRPTRPAHAPL